MAQQLVEFVASSGQTLTANLFPIGSNQLVQAALVVTEDVERPGVYQAQFSGVPLDVYQLIVLRNDGRSAAVWYTNIDDTAEHSNVVFRSGTYDDVTDEGVDYDSHVVNFVIKTTGGDAIANCDVIVTLDEEGTNVASGGATRGDGSVRIPVEDLTYYVFQFAEGYIFSNPQQVTIAAETTTITLTNGRVASEVYPEFTPSDDVTCSYHLAISESLYGSTCFEYTGEITSDGDVSFALDEDLTKYPGVYFAQASIYNTDVYGNRILVLANTFYLTVVAGASTDIRSGPPSMAEVRLVLRDTDPSESALLDNLAFSDEEIMFCITRPVSEWNELPPDVAQFSTQTFPFRYHWLEAIAGNLFLIAAEQYRRNQLNYAAAGVTVNDSDKEPNYESAGMRRLQIWRDFVRRKKAEINLNMSFGTVSSDYGGW